MIAKVRIPNYALNFEGVNDYLQNNAGTPLTQWERTQPWTFFAKVRQNNRAGSFFLNGVETGGGNFRGIWIVRVASGQWQIYLRSLSPTNEGSILVTASDALALEGIVQITYDGSSDANGVSLYVNNGSMPLTISNNNLTGSIINSLNRLWIGRGVNIAPNWFNGSIEEISFVNYEKSPAELTSDFNLGTQTAGSGSFLLNVKPIFPTNITSLDTTVPFSETAQNLDINIIGKTNPMLLNTDLVKYAEEFKFLKINLRP